MPEGGGTAEYDRIAGLAAAHGLEIFGAFHPVSDDGAPKGVETLLLLGPSEPGFWPHVTAQPEFADGGSDPLDRWSRRVIGRMACDLGGKALFPFGGPPWHPFITWAKRTGRAWESPVQFLVHDRAGLMVSYRGALGLKRRINLPPPPAGPPCADCERPCLSACPVGALSANGYDIGTCHDFLDTHAGGDCMIRGCAVRRACPVSRTHGRLEEQSAWHMRRFHP